MKETDPRERMGNKSLKASARWSREIWSLLMKVEQAPDAKLFPHMLSFVKDVALLHECLRGSSVTLERFQTDEFTEFSFELHEHGGDIAFVSKGWDDPGIRVEDVLYIENADIPIFKNALDDILNVCWDRGVCFHFHPEGQRLRAEIWTPLHIDGLTPRGFFDALKCLEKCKRQIHALCPFER